MKPSKAATLSILLLCLTLSACQTTDSRIRKQQDLFDSYTAEQRQLIQVGEVAIGFDPEQVRMALGKPDDELTVETEQGKQLVWLYTKTKPSLGLSIGGGSGGLGGGIGIGTGGQSQILKRIVFNRLTGAVEKIERFD